MKPTRLLSHLPVLLAPRPTLSILGSRIAFQSPIKTSRFVSSRYGVNRRKKGSSPQRNWAHKPQPDGTWNFSRQHRPQPAGPRHLQQQRQHQHQDCAQLARRPQRWCGCRMLRKPQSRFPAPDSLHRKWSGSLAQQQHLLRGAWVHQASAYTCLDPSVPSHSTWQGLESSIRLTLPSLDYGPEILRGEDADGLTQGTGAEFSSNPVVPCNSDIYVETATLGTYKETGEPK